MFFPGIGTLTGSIMGGAYGGEFGDCFSDTLEDAYNYASDFWEVYRQNTCCMFIFSELMSPFWLYWFQIRSSITKKMNFLDCGRMSNSVLLDFDFVANNINNFRIDTRMTNTYGLCN